MSQIILLVDSHYALFCFPLRNDEQYRIPELLRSALRLPRFRTKAARMWLVVQVAPTLIRYWKLGVTTLQTVAWE